MEDMEGKRGRRPRVQPRIHKKVTMNMKPEVFEHYQEHADGRDITMTALITGALALYVDFRTRVEGGGEIIVRNPETGHEMDVTDFLFSPQERLIRNLDRALGPDA